MYTVSIYLTVNADEETDAQALADELVEKIERHDSKYADIVLNTIASEIEEEE